MSAFRDTEAARQAQARLELESDVDLAKLFDEAFTRVANPDLALTNLERWLLATGNPALYLQQLAAVPRRSELLFSILGASQPIADCLIQNPELASLVLEQGPPEVPPQRESVISEGRRLLANSTSFRHSLDRLRYLRQRWNLVIVLNDLWGTWRQPVVWRALSELADAIVMLTVDEVWQDQRRRRDLPEECTLLVVGFGKLGGLELNYSSDIDLVYVIPDGIPERLERDCTKFAEALGRALSEPMGRGFLYRVDLRLRPYGGAGPIVRSARAIEAYYKLYAEPWEVQALLRSRPLCGPSDLQERWAAMRVSTCFRPRMADFRIEEMVQMRARIEERADDDDLKRGRGGIRDIEFLTQAKQLLHGFEVPALQTPSTLDALVAIEEVGILDPEAVSELRSAYVLFRKLEHRIQLVSDRQTHSLPTRDLAREALARSMDFAAWADLSSRLNSHRRAVRSLYEEGLGGTAAPACDRDAVEEVLGDYGGAALQWFDAMPESESFYSVLVHNRDSLDRVRRLIVAGPVLVSTLKTSVELTELLLSGELEEGDLAPETRIGRLSPEADLRDVASAYHFAHARHLAEWVLNPTFDPSHGLCRLADGLIRFLLARLQGEIEVIALGSYGTLELGPASDLDLLFLAPPDVAQPDAESQAQRFLSKLSEVRRLGAPVSFDLRLRPDGGKGLLARSHGALRQYARHDMEWWERFALGHARLVHGTPEAIRLVREVAFGDVPDEVAISELLRMKRRIETERVQPQHVRRNVKLGFGGLTDIEWTIRMSELSSGGFVPDVFSTRAEDRMNELVRRQLLTTIEKDALIEAHRFLLRLRFCLHLQGHADDLLPENPHRLDRLAAVLGMQSGNVLLARYQEITQTVRSLFLESVERLRR